jgi:transitional endoplasmic reticulum ATPase
VIENDLPLFDADSEIAADRRVAWLCRIDLLREAGRLTEALAWACLECELHPDNVAALAVKEELKRLTRFGGRPPTGTLTPGMTKMVRWRGLAGMRQLRAELEQGVIAPLMDPDLYRRYKIPLPNGILLYGPPGCGKTFIANKLAEIIGFKFFDIGPSDLGSIYVHGGQKLIQQLFRKAESAAPAMIFFDEFDALVPSRAGAAGHHYEAEVNELLTQLNECAERRILVVAATNQAEKIDRAVLRPGRFDKHFFVGPPDIEARVELFRLYLAERPAHAIDYLKLGQASEAYTPAEIREMVNEAARSALAKRKPIDQENLLQAIAERQPALKPEETVRRRIGFQAEQ